MQIINTGRVIHIVSLTDSDIGFLRSMLTTDLREYNQLEKELIVQENHVWEQCNPAELSQKSKLSFEMLNMIRDAKRKIAKKKKHCEAIQKSLRKSFTLPVVETE